MNKVIDTVWVINDNEHIGSNSTTNPYENNTMNIHKDCYMYTELCDSLDEVKEHFSHWSNVNDEVTIVSHSVSLHGTSYLLSIVYYYIQYW